MSLLSELSSLLSDFSLFPLKVLFSLRTRFLTGDAIFLLLPLLRSKPGIAMCRNIEQEVVPGITTLLSTPRIAVCKNKLRQLCQLWMYIRGAVVVNG